MSERVPPSPPMPEGAFVLSLTDETVSKCTLASRSVPCCLDLSNWNTAPGSHFAIDNCHPSKKGSNQLFTAASTSGSYSQLRVMLDGMCLTAEATGGAVTASPCKAGDLSQLWSSEVHCGETNITRSQCLSMPRHRCILLPSVVVLHRYVA